MGVEVENNCKGQGGSRILLNFLTRLSKNPVWQHSSVGSKRRSKTCIGVCGVVVATVVESESLEYQVLFHPESRLLTVFCWVAAAALRDFFKRRGGRMGLPSESNSNGISWLVLGATLSTGSVARSGGKGGRAALQLTGSGKWNAGSSSCGETGFESGKWGETRPPVPDTDTPPPVPLLAPDPLRLTGAKRSRNFVSALDSCFFKLKFFFFLWRTPFSVLPSSSVVALASGWFCSSSAKTSTARSTSVSIHSFLIVSVSSTLFSTTSF